MRLLKHRKFVDNRKNVLCFSILIVLFFITIGYAYLTSNLSITGATTVAGNTWNIHFENLQVSTGSVDAITPAAIDINDNTLINYSVLLGKPGDFYEFTVDMVNAGSLPGKVTVVELNGITPAVEDVIDYSIVYTNNNSPVAINDILNAEFSKNIKVRVQYKEDIANEDLLATNEDLTLTFDVTFNQSDEEESPFSPVIQQLIDENPSCMTKYEGEVTDRVGETVTAQNVYFNKCEDKRNIIFGGFCWQMIRTTETGGIKMIYNGEPDNDGKCEPNRADHKGIVISDYTSQTINTNYLYGSSFLYDTTTNEFTLVDTTLETWSDSTYENLLGKYTCKNTTGICTILYQVNSYYSNTNAFLSHYIIGDTKYSQIGMKTFNGNGESLAMAGYMFNKVYNYKQGFPPNISLWGNDVSYNNGVYTLLPASGEDELVDLPDDNHHYTCNNMTGMCNKVSFYYYSDGRSAHRYIELDGEANIEEAVNNMLYNDNVNKYSSSIKVAVDAWYAQNLLSKTDLLEDTIYCNARNMNNQATNGWNKNGFLNSSLYFENMDLLKNLVCLNDTDQFAVGNSKAKLTYPVGLLDIKELNNMFIYPSFFSSLMATDVNYWSISPSYYSSAMTYICVINKNGSKRDDYAVNYSGIRPVVSLASDSLILEGDGSEVNPWVVE